MSASNHATVHAHTAQLFDSPASLGEHVARFLAADLPDDARLLVITKAVHWVAIASALEARGVPVAEWIKEGRLHLLDAENTIDQLTVSGALDVGRFMELAGAFIEGLLRESPGGVRVYGEGVDVLADQGRLADVCRVEVAADRLQKRLGFTMLCGYSAKNLWHPRANDAVTAIGRAHDEMRASDADLLAASILGTLKV